MRIFVKGVDRDREEPNPTDVDFCKRGRIGFKPDEEMVTYLPSFPVALRNTRCAISPNQPYGYEYSPILLDFKEEYVNGERLILYRFEIRKRKLYCNGSKSAEEKDKELVVVEQPDKTSDKPSREQRERNLKQIRIGTPAPANGTPTSTRLPTSSVFGKFEDPEISGMEFEAKIRARLDALGASISTTTVTAMTQFGNTFQVAAGTVITKEQLPAEFFSQNSGVNNFDYYVITKFTTTNSGSTWDGSSFDVPLSNVGITTTVMTVRPTSREPGKPDFVGYSQKQALDRFSEGLKSTVRNDLFSPSFTKSNTDVGGSGKADSSSTKSTSS